MNSNTTAGMEVQLDERATELGHHVQTILKEFQRVHCAVANGPHASLNNQEMRVIEFLGNESSQNMRSLADFLSLAVNSVTSVVDGLEQKELVVRNRSATDRRVVLVELTETGCEVWRAIAEAKQALYRALLSPLTSTEQAHFLDLFRKIAQETNESISCQVKN